MTEDKLQELIHTCHLIHQKNLVSGSGGNVSCRTEDGFVITASGVALEAASRENLVKVHLDGSYEGERKPSKEYLLHLSCYLKRPDVEAIVHVHSVYAVALSCLTESNSENVVPVYTPGFGLRIGHLPVIPYLRPGSPELASCASSVIAGRDTVLMKNHGVIAVGHSTEDAMNLVEEIEENAKIHFILEGKGQPLTDLEISELTRYLEKEKRYDKSRTLAAWN